jgi:general secretion pathway protein D
MIDWRHRLFLAGLACMYLAACSSFRETAGTGSPDLIAELSTADLGATRQQRPDPRTEFASADPSRPRVHEYPGEDQAAPIRRTDFAGVAKGRDGYELNFDDAGLGDFVKLVLSDTLGIPYVMDPRIQGRVTVSTGGPVSREELLSLLEAVLSMNRGVMIAEGRSYRIVPDTGGAQVGAVNVDYLAERRQGGAGYGLAVMPLRYVSAATMMQMLKSFAGENALKASVYKNVLMIRGAGKERQSLIEIATMFDVDWMKGQSAGIYVLKSASPAEIIGELQQVFQTEGQGGGLVNFQPVNRLNAVLVLTQKSALLEKAGQWIARLDRASAEGDDNYYVYRLENGKAKDVAALLNDTFGTGSGRSSLRASEESEVAPGKGASTIASPDADEGDASAAEPETRAETRLSSSSSSAPAVKADVTVGLSSGAGSAAPSGEVRIIADKVNNKLLIRAPARVYRKILSVLYRIDRAPLQVLINATLAEVTLTDDLQYGVQFYLQGKGGTFGFSTGDAVQIEPSAPGLNFMFGSRGTPKVIIDALATETAVRVVSSPTVVVLHNQAATLQVGDEVPVATRQVSSVTNPDAPLVNEVQFRDTGVILKVTPRINSNGLVTMDVQQEISSVVASTSQGDSGTLTPTISQRRISSMIAVQDGQMVILGGLISEQSDKQKSRVPVINRIPILGDVIGDTSRSKQRKELIVFLQPKVIKDGADASQLAEEVRSRMQFLAPPRASAGPVRFK